MNRIFKRLSLLSLALVIGLLPAIAACDGKDPLPEDPTNGPTENLPEEPPEASVVEVKFNQTELYLATLEGYDSATLSASVYIDDILMEDAPVYTVADDSIASIEGATVTAIGAGETVVTASFTTDEGTATASIPLVVLAGASADAVNKFDESAVNLFGRTYTSSKKLTFDNVCTGIEVAFAGTQLAAKLSVSAKNKVRVYVDGDTEGQTLVLENTTAKSTVLCKNLENGVHTVRILKASSPMYGKVFLPDTAAFVTDGTFLAAREKSELKIEFIGDSITAGCGANGASNEPLQTVENSDSTLAFAYLTAQTLGADFSMMALEGICAKDGATNSYDLYNRYSPNNTSKYDASSFDADVVVLALGENDVWHATSDQFPNYNLTLFRADYADMLRLIRKAHPQAKIVCVYGMMPASARADGSQAMKNAIADTGDDNITTLQLVTNERGANYHPNASAHKTNATRLAKHISELIG